MLFCKVIYSFISVHLEQKEGNGEGGEEASCCWTLPMENGQAPPHLAQDDGQSEHLPGAPVELGGEARCPTGEGGRSGLSLL